MFHKSRILAAVLLAVFYCAGPVRSAFPPYFNFQGKLTDDAGQPVDNNTLNFDFKLFTSETGLGSTGWTESHTVQVENGLYSVILGTSTSLLTVDFTAPLWLEITVNGDKLSPRYRLTSTPYSFYAGTAAYAASGGSADNLGNHTATQNLNMAGFGIINTTITFTDGTSIGSTTPFTSDSELTAATDTLLSKSSATVTYLNLAGGAMTGDLVMSGSINPGGIVKSTSVYSQNAGLLDGNDSSYFLSVSSASATYLHRAGGSMSGNIDMAKNEIKNIVVDNQSTPPLTPAGGQLYYDKQAQDKGVLFYYDGNQSSWISLSGGAAAGDNLGNHVATTTLNMAGFGIIDTTITFTDGTSIGSTTPFVSDGELTASTDTLLSKSSATVTYLNLAGGTMSGNIDMGSGNIVDVYNIKLSTISSGADKVVISTYTEVWGEVEASGFVLSGSRYSGSASFSASTFTAVDLSLTPLPDTSYSVFCELDFNNSGYYINCKTTDGFVISLSTECAESYSGGAGWMIFRHR